MGETRRKNLGEPDETIRFPGVINDIVDLEDMSIARVLHEPGFRWSTHMRPLVGGDWCEIRHVGYVVSGRLGMRLRDGSTIEFGPNDVFDVAPGHDGYTIGDAPCIAIEWVGNRAYMGFRAGMQDRVTATLLMTDLVGSTAEAVRMGDMVWREVLARHLGAAREQIVLFHGREVETTGDGMLAMFDGTARALRCAASIREAARHSGLRVRVGVHVGEVDVVGTGLRGVALHETARIMAVAAPDEILVSETTRAVALSSGLSFEDRGPHELKGLSGARTLFAYVSTEVDTATEPTQ